MTTTVTPQPGASPSATRCVRDEHHFVTESGVYGPEDFGFGDDIQPVPDVSERYVGGVDFTPQAVGVDLWVVNGDALAIVEALQSQGIDARPLYAFAFEGHWSLEPGSDRPEVVSFVGSERVDGTGPVTAAEVNAAMTRGTRTSPIVGIVDGFAPASGSISDMIANEDSGGLAGNALSLHGRFVESIIRLLAPAAVIVTADVAKVHPRFVGAPHRGLAASDEPPEEDDVLDASLPFTDGMAIADAINRLVAQDAEFINLSLGTYVCSLDGGESFLDSMPVALAIAAAERVEVIAAGGNDVLHKNLWRSNPAFFPAVHPEVLGVGASSLRGQPVQWDHQGMRVGSPPEWWDLIAPGVDLVGGEFMSGADRAVRWSGSSFASAVVTGVLASGCVPFDPDAFLQTLSGQDLPTLSYTDVPGLLWWDGTKIVYNEAPASGCFDSE